MWINPIKYDLPELVDTYSTVQSTVSLGSPAGNLPIGALSGAIYPSTMKCDNPSDCDSALVTLTADHTKLLNAFNARYNYAVNAIQILTNASAQYDYLIASKANAEDWSEPTLDASVKQCIVEIAAYANWLNPGGDSVADVPLQNGSVCQNAPAMSATVLQQMKNLFTSLQSFENEIDQLKLQIDQNKGAFGTQVADYKTALQDIDLGADVATGGNGSALHTTEQSLRPFYDVNLAYDSSFRDVRCHPHQPDGSSHALQLSANNRFSASSPLAVSVATVDCPGAVAVSAGAGISTVPVVTYQLGATLSGTPPTAAYTITEQSRSSQTVAVALVHYLVEPLGGQAALFATAGFGTSTSQVDAFYGLSLGVGRRVFVNVLEHVGTVTVLQPGLTVGEAAPSGFTIPTLKQTATRIAFVLTFGTAFSSSSSAPASSSSAGGGGASPNAKPGH
jgi:hypothetical protein